jgi:type IV secretion system protein VirB1
VFDFLAVAQQCAINVEPAVMSAIVHTESNFNPYAIGVVNSAIKQPTNHTDAVKAVRLLRSQGKNFSVGLAQVNKINFKTYNMNERNMFDPCTNLRAGSSIFANCLKRADNQYGSKHSYDGKLRLAMSCYYSGNFKTGFRADFKGQPPYVTKVFSKVNDYRNNKQQVLPESLPTALPINSKDLAAYPQNSNTAINNQIIQGELPTTRSNAVKIIDKVNQDLIDVQVQNSKESVFIGDVFTVSSTDLFSAQNQY